MCGTNRLPCAKAKGAGLTDGPAASGAFAAADGTKRTIKVETKPSSSGTEVKLGYTQDE